VVNRVATLSKSGTVFCLLAACGFLAACASVTSVRRAPQAGDAPKNGLAYFLPKAHVLVTVRWNPALRSWDVAPTVVYEADPTERFDLDWSNSILSDKDTTIAVDPATGLLQSINAGYPGQNVNSIGTTIGAAPNLIRLPTMIAPVTSYDGSAFTGEQFQAFARQYPSQVVPQGSAYATTAQVVVNDTDRPEAMVLVTSPDVPGSARSSRLYAAIKVTLRKRFELGANFPRNRKWAIDAYKSGGGIAVRLPVPYELTVQEVLSSDATFQDNQTPRITCATAPQTVMLPDSQHDFLYRILSRPLVSDATKITLSNGMIQSLEQLRPSVLAALLQIPKYLVTNVVPLPIEIDQTQQNISNAQSKVSTQSAGSTATEDRSTDATEDK
jgi:hypothetical protein